MDRPAAWRDSAIDIEAEPAFRVGGATIDPISRDAEFSGSRERLQPQTLKVLIALTRAKGHVVMRSDLIASCWEGRIVGEDVINRSISLLRGFAERAGGFEIETVPKAGYRLVDGMARHPARARNWVAAAVITFLMLVGTGIWLSKGSRSDPTDKPSVIVLPLEAIQSPASEVAEAARNALTVVIRDEGYSVTAEGSGEATTAGDFIVNGNVVRAANTVQATVRVERRDPRIRTATLQFEAPVHQSGSLPAQISAQVAAALSLSDALLSLENRHRTDQPAAELFEQANLLITGEEPLRAFPTAGRIAQRTPDSSVSQWLLAMNTGLVVGQLPVEQRAGALAVGRQSAERARTLQPQSGLNAIPWCLLHSPARLAECEDSLRNGLRIDPDTLLVSQYLSDQLSAVGRADEALQFARVGFARNRYMPGDIARLLRSLEATGHPGEAERLYEQARRWWPKYRWFFWARTGGMLERGDFDRLERFATEPESARLLRGFETPGLFAALRRADVTEAKRECAIVSDPSVRIVLCMLGLARLGDMDGAYRIADQLYPRLVGGTARDEEWLWLRQWEGPPYPYLTGVAAEPMRRDPRYLSVAHRVGLLAYWRSGRLPDFCTRTREALCASISQGR